MAFPYDQLGWLQDTPLADAIAVSDLLFPSIETVHVLALSLVVGSIARVDLRLLGFGVGHGPIKRVARQILPLTWISFAIALASGLLLFASNAVKYFDNTAFRLKFALMILAGLNMVVLHLFAWRSIGEADARVPLAARVAGALSLLVWVGIVAAGRWVGFTAQ